jgi:hypothetical protein
MARLTKAATLTLIRKVTELCHAENYGRLVPGLPWAERIPANKAALREELSKLFGGIRVPLEVTFECGNCRRDLPGTVETDATGGLCYDRSHCGCFGGVNADDDNRDWSPGQAWGDR